VVLAETFLLAVFAGYLVVLDAMVVVSFDQIFEDRLVAGKK